MGCGHCQAHGFWQKLGRCRRCMLLSLLLGLVAGGSWWWWDAPRSVEGIALLMATASGWGLLLAHLLRAWWLRLAGRG